jgi:protein-tyrosine phosphatase
MDSNNYQDVIRLARNSSDQKKVKLILNYSYPKSNKAVPDPYYEGGFGYVFTELELAIEVLIKDYL